MWPWLWQGLGVWDDSLSTLAAVGRAEPGPRDGIGAGMGRWHATESGVCVVARRPGQRRVRFRLARPTGCRLSLDLGVWQFVFDFVGLARGGRLVHGRLLARDACLRWSVCMLHLRRRDLRLRDQVLMRRRRQLCPHGQQGRLRGALLGLEGLEGRLQLPLLRLRVPNGRVRGYLLLGPVLRRCRGRAARAGLPREWGCGTAGVLGRSCPCRITLWGAPGAWLGLLHRRAEYSEESFQSVRRRGASGGSSRWCSECGRGWGRRSLPRGPRAEERRRRGGEVRWESVLAP